MRTSVKIGKILWITVVALAGLVPALAADIFVTSNISVSETWTPDNVYILTDVIYVTDGATLTIEPGTVVRGETESAPGANDPGTLVVTRDSKIRILGTELEPVVFTDLYDDNIGHDPGTFPYDSLENAIEETGNWGGLIVLGRGWVANNTAAGPDPTREVQIEGLTAAGGLGFYGNCAAVHPGDPLADPSWCDDDDSGTVRYLSIRYGGFNLSVDNEINGLTLGAVGRATDFDYIEVFQNKDDGVEFFGGAAQIKHLVSVNVGDELVDYDEGWRGRIQYV
ncbi:MAG: hypothetical protein Q9Q40_14255, partial [Acidobacteriota bacterium]|nr:hypothetical protein [Acidobacteriota bacterium]